jgi:hypothetical protein
MKTFNYLGFQIRAMPKSSKYAVILNRTILVSSLSSAVFIVDKYLKTSKELYT